MNTFWIFDKWWSSSFFLQRRISFSYSQYQEIFSWRKLARPPVRISHLSDSAVSKCCVLISKALLLALDPHLEWSSPRLHPSCFIALAEGPLLSKIYTPSIYIYHISSSLPTLFTVHLSRQGPTVYPRLASSCLSSCLSLPTAEITGKHHRTQLNTSCTCSLGFWTIGVAKKS